MYAGFWKRFLAFIIDSFILYVPLTILLVIFILFAAINPDNPLMSIYINLFGNLLFVLATVLYWAIFEASSLQATPGKLALGIKVTDENGQRISFLRALGRNFGKIVSNVTLYIGYVMAGFTVRRQALHDKMAETFVIDKKMPVGPLPEMPKASTFQIVLAILGALSPIILCIVGIILAIVLGAALGAAGMPEAANSAANAAAAIK